MKKFIVAILAMLYISTSAGATLHIHYCMGKQSDWGFGLNNATICSRCGMEEKDNGCCKKEHRFFKNNTDQKTTESALQLIKLIAVAIPFSFVEIPSFSFASKKEVNPINYKPPRRISIALYIRNCVFLI